MRSNVSAGGTDPSFDYLNTRRAYGAGGFVVFLSILWIVDAGLRFGRRAVALCRRADRSVADRPLIDDVVSVRLAK